MLIPKTLLLLPVDILIAILLTFPVLLIIAYTLESFSEFFDFANNFWRNAPIEVQTFSLITFLGLLYLTVQLTKAFVGG